MYAHAGGKLLAGSQQLDEVVVGVAAGEESDWVPEAGQEAWLGITISTMPMAMAMAMAYPEEHFVERNGLHALYSFVLKGDCVIFISISISISIISIFISISINEVRVVGLERCNGHEVLPPAVNQVPSPRHVMLRLRGEPAGPREDIPRPAWVGAERLPLRVLGVPRVVPWVVGEVAGGGGGGGGGGGRAKIKPREKVVGEP